MPGRNRGDDASLHDLIGNLTARPLANRTLGLRRLLTSQGHDLAHLIGRDLGQFAGSVAVLQAFLHRKISQRYRLQQQPAIPPLTSHIDADIKLARDLLIVQPCAGCQDDASPWHKPLFCAVSLDQLFQSQPLGVTQGNGGWFRAFHIAASACSEMTASYLVATSLSTGDHTPAAPQPGCTRSSPDRLRRRCAPPPKYPWASHEDRQARCDRN